MAKYISSVQIKKAKQTIKINNQHRSACVPLSTKTRGSKNIKGINNGANPTNLDWPAGQGLLAKQYGERLKYIFGSQLKILYKTKWRASCKHTVSKSRVNPKITSRVLLANLGKTQNKEINKIKFWRIFTKCGTLIRNSSGFAPHGHMVLTALLGMLFLMIYSFFTK